MIVETILKKIKAVMHYLYKKLYFNNRPLINLVIAGEQKCGTSSLDNLLRQHPRIAGGIGKEKNIFNNATLFSAKGKLKKQTSVLKHYHSSEIFKRKQYTYFLDSSPDYVFRGSAIPRLIDYNPNCKLVYLLRDPVERFISSYNFFFHMLNYESPYFQLDEDTKRMKSFYYANPKLSFQQYFELETGDNPIFEALERGLYFKNAQWLLKHVDSKNVYFIKMESITNSLQSETTMTNFFTFLDIKPIENKMPHKHKSNNSKFVPDTKYVAWLQDYYKSDQAELEQLFKGVDH